MNTNDDAGADYVGTGLRIKGELSGKEDLLVEGTVEGPIHLADHRLTVGPSGKLTSDVVAREIIVHGNVKGNLRASERIEIMKNGSVVGDLTTARILIEDGASFKGSIEIEREAATILSDTPPQARVATAAGNAQRGKTT
jgi:cytoskeletal protein CcmA (bactofilin family)